MRRPKRWRGAVAAIVLMGLALLGTGVSAMGSSMPEAEGKPVSAMSDGMPCALCYIAPAPSPTVSTDEVTEPASLIWWVHPEPPRNEVKPTVRVRRRDRVPIRVTLCRWTN